MILRDSMMRMEEHSALRKKDIKTTEEIEESIMDLERSRIKDPSYGFHRNY